MQINAARTVSRLDIKRATLIGSVLAPIRPPSNNTDSVIDTRIPASTTPLHVLDAHARSVLARSRANAATSRPLQSAAPIAANASSKLPSAPAEVDKPLSLSNRTDSETDDEMNNRTNELFYTMRMTGITSARGLVFQFLC